MGRLTPVPSLTGLRGEPARKTSSAVTGLEASIIGTRLTAELGHRASPNNLIWKAI